MIQAVIFDFDGTLMNTLPGISHFCNTALEEINLPPIEEDKYKYFVGNGRDVLIHRILDYYNADLQENYEKVGKRYDKEYEKDILFGTVIYDGINDLLATLKENNIKIGILTNKPHNVACQIIKTVFGETFDIFYGQRIGIATKPSPAAAIDMAAELNLKTIECAFVGDTIVDITTGKNAGMYTIGVLWGFREENELKDADAIVSTPDEILKLIKEVK